MLHAIKKKVLHVFVALGVSLLSTETSWSQSSNPSLPFPVFKVGYDETENADGKQVGFASLIDHRGILLSANHVFWAEEDQDGNSDSFYIKYRGKKLWLYQLLFKEIKGIENFPNDGPVLLSASLSKKIGADQKIKFNNFREPFPYYNKFTISNPLNDQTYMPEIKLNDNGSSFEFTGHFSLSLKSLKTGSEWCPEVFSTGVGGIKKGRSGSPVFDKNGNISGVVTAKNQNSENYQAIIIPSRCIVEALAISYYEKLRIPLANLWEDWRVDEIRERSAYNKTFKHYLGKNDISIFDWLQLVSALQITNGNSNAMYVKSAIDDLFPVIFDEDNTLRSTVHAIIEEKSDSALDYSAGVKLSQCPNIGLVPLVDAYNLRSGQNLNIVLEFDLNSNCASHRFRLFSFKEARRISSDDISGWASFQRNHFPASRRPSRQEVINFIENEEYEELLRVEKNLLASVAASYNAAILAHISFDRYGDNEKYRTGRMVDFLDWTVRLMEFYDDSRFPNNNSGIDKESFCSFVSKFTTQLQAEIDSGVELGIDYRAYMIENINYAASSCSES